MSNSIVTIQLGNYANFIGSHYWNLHEYSFNNKNDNLIDPDVHFSEGFTTTNRTTYTPRLISMDWKENLGANIIDNVYEDIENEGKVAVDSRRDIDTLKIHSYSGKVDMHTGFTKKELSVNVKDTILSQTNYCYWNEYLYSRYHPRSLNAIPKLYRGFNKDNFTAFSQGSELSSTREFRDIMEDHTRYFVEKCDSIQGFQMICDSNSGFSGVAATWLDHLKDEYRQPVLSIPVSNASITNSPESLFNIISIFTSLSGSSVSTLPLSLLDIDNNFRSFKNIIYDCNSNYSTSAIIAVALKSLLLPCLFKQKLYSLSDFRSLVDGRNNSLVSLALSLPLPIQDLQTLCSSLASATPDTVFTSLSPQSSSLSNVHSIIGNIFGVPESRVLCTSNRSHPLFKHSSTAANAMELFLGDGLKPHNCRFFGMPAPVRLDAPFPKIFSSSSGEAHLPHSVPMSSMVFSGETEATLMPLYVAAKDALRRNRLADVLCNSERDALVDVLEQFRNIV